MNSFILICWLFFASQSVLSQDYTLDQLLLLGSEGRPLETNTFDEEGAMVQRIARTAGITAGYNARLEVINSGLMAADVELTKIYNFASFLIRIDSGNVIFPPVVIEYGGTANVNNSGTRIEETDHSYRVFPAKLVLSTPTWQEYLYSTPSKFISINPLSLPKSAGQKKIWADALAKGYESGLHKANMRFKRRKQRLNRVFKGIILYHELVSRDLMKELYIGETETGITLQGNTLTIGGRLVQITRPAQFNSNGEVWKPVIIQTEVDF